MKLTRSRPGATWLVTIMLMVSLSGCGWRGSTACRYLVCRAADRGPSRSRRKWPMFEISRRIRGFVSAT